MTKREVLNAMLKDENIKHNTDYIAYIENELAILKKKTENRKPTKNQLENEIIKTIILDILNTEIGMTVAELQKNENLAKYSNQKITAVLRLLRNENKVIAYGNKRNFYKLA